MKSSLYRTLTPILAIIGLAAMVPATANASKGDPDRDGLNNRQERKFKTNPRKADTDRDTLKDGREVKKFKTNPRKADTDGDGVRDGREVKSGLDPRDSDSDDDGTSDQYEREGVIIAIDGESVTIRDRFGVEITFTVDAATFLEGADRDGDGVLTLADFAVSDRVEANLSANGARAVTFELEADEDDQEVEGRISVIDGDRVTVGTGSRAQSFTVDGDTFVRAPDRNGDGSATLADLEVGDEIEAHLSADGSRALSLEVEYDEDDYGDDDGYDDSDDNSNDDDSDDDDSNDDDSDDDDSNDDD